jgi:hypothetical protein
VTEQPTVALASLGLSRIGEIFCAVMLTQEAGQISEMRACEALGLTREMYREKKAEVIAEVANLLVKLRSPLSLILENMKVRQEL